MSKKKNKQREIKKPPLWVVILMISSIFIGAYTGVIGIINIENYYHPYWFGIIFGGFGLVVGILIAKRVKPYIAVNRRLKNDYGMSIMYISTGFIGVSLMFGSILNQSLSEIYKYDTYTITNKYRQEKRVRTPEVNSLVVNINGQSQRLVCSRDYWNCTYIGKDITLSLYKSKLGFDFIKISNDKK